MIFIKIYIGTVYLFDLLFPKYTKVGYDSFISFE